jgi:iron complex outermembrane recepter protein
MAIRKFRTLSSLVVASIASGILVTSTLAQSRSYHFDISNQSLSQALRNYGQISGQEIIFTEDVVAGVNTTSLKGDYTAQAALDILLRGTGLIAERSPAGALMIRRPRGTSTASSAPLSLDRTAYAGIALHIAQSGAETPDPATAQSSSQTSSGTDANALEEVVVTAQKRSERLEDVPISVSVITGTALRNFGVGTTTELSTLVPGFVAQERTGSFVPYLRGVGSVDPSAANESIVSTYVDGVYLVSMPAGLMSLADVQQIEVLKGPQGTLFGRNSMGGVVNIITQIPSSTPQGNIEVGYGNYNTTNMSAYVTGGLTENVSGDVSAAYQHQGEGWGTNVNTGAQVGRIDYVAARSKLYLDLPTLQATLAFDYSSSDTDASMIYTPYFKNEALAGGQGPYTGGFYDATGTFPAFNKVTQWGTSLKLKYDLGWGEFTSISAARRTDQSLSFGQDHTALQLLDVTQTATTPDYTEELQLASPTGNKVSWIAGVFYLNHDVKPLEDVYQRAYSGSVLRSLATVVYDYSIRTASLAGYGQATVPIGFRTNLTVGARLTSDDESFSKIQTLNGANVPVPAMSHQLDYKKWTWRLALDHKFSDDVMGYASYSRGFKSGVWNVTIPTPSASQPEQLDAYELGLKSDLFDRRVEINAAVFDYEYNNIQYNVIQNGTSQVENAASARIQGLDLDGSFSPAAHLRISAGAEWLRQRDYTSFPSGVVYVPSGTVIDGTTHTCATPNCLYSGAFTGNKILLAPSITGNLAVNYTVPAQTGDVDLNVASSYTSEYYRTIDNRLTQPAYGLVNAGASWTPMNRNLTIRAWVKNLNGAEYHVFGAAVNYGYVGGPGAPRTFGASLRYKF